MTDTKKRFIVTYADPSVDAAGAAQVLGVPTDEVSDGVAAFASDKSLKESEVHHLEGIGSSVLELSDREAEKLKADGRVVSVVEDFEVHALQGVHIHEPANGGAEEIFHNDYSDQMNEEGQADYIAEYAQTAYASGYNQAVTDAYKYLTKRAQKLSNGAEGADGTPDLRPPFPPIFRPPFPRPPIFPIPPVFSQPVGWNIKLVRANSAWNYARGRNIRVAVLDTGIAAHPDLVIAGGASMIPGVGSFNDGNGHGTHCAGIIGARNNRIGVVGVAPLCSLYAVKVLDDAGSGMLSWILAGMTWALQNNMRVVSMSLGSNVASPNAPCVPAYQQAAQQLLNAGCVVVAAAGNSGAGSTPWVGNPARCSNYVAVAAVDQNKAVAPFSSRGAGNIVDISAPGVSINSTWLGNGYRQLSGTSMACPHVAGAVALMRERFSGWTAAQVRARLASSASDLGVPGTDEATGAGLLDCLTAVS